MVSSMIVIVSLLLIFLGCVFLVLSYLITQLTKRKKNSLHLPNGDVTYADLHKPAKPLFSINHRLSGKPDYIIHHDELLIPVEYKSGRYTHPAAHHILQLAAYCQLIEDVEDQCVPFGWIVYPTGRFKIPFNAQLRLELQHTIDEIREKIHNSRPERSHNFVRRCQNCSYNAVCSGKMD
jgi:CRISPR-associated protein Cas4